MEGQTFFNGKLREKKLDNAVILKGMFPKYNLDLIPLETSSCSVFI